MVQYLADDEGKGAWTRAQWLADGYAPRRGARPSIRRVVVRESSPTWRKRIRLVDAPTDTWEVEDEVLVYSPDQVVPISSTQASASPSVPQSPGGHASSSLSACPSSAGHASSASSVDDDGVRVLSASDLGPANQ